MILYKYLAPEKARECLIGHDSIWLTPPIFLNDVQEFRILREEADEEELKVMFDQFQCEKPLQVSFERFREQITRPEFRESERHAMQLLLSENMGVASFTSEPINELMWAHYAQNRGVAIGYEASDESLLYGMAGRELPFGLALRVEYGNDPPIISKDFSNAARALTWKRLAWAYEREWRIVRNLQDARPVSHRDKTFHGLPACKDRVAHVVFGILAEKEFEDSIIGWLHGSGAQIQKIESDPATQAFVLVDYSQRSCPNTPTLKNPC